jgi:tRNA A-37 threonylcarbamoyl transferase component Bud32
MQVYVDGRQIRLDPRKAIGKGGEADIYDVSGRALKVFKPPSHPDYEGQPHEQEGARRRIAEHQTKLRQFPTNLPERVVVPEGLITDKSGNKIRGYRMRLVGGNVLMRYAERTFREAVSNDTVRNVFRDLHRTVQGIHRANVVIGDFNDLNVLVDGSQAFLIDADSFQFGNFPCRVFTARFVDPRHCAPDGSGLAKPHTADSDWYAFAVMLMQSLLFVDPYGGVFKPKDPGDRVSPAERPLKRITVFHPEVKYPKPAVPYAVLPDELLDRFQRTFERDERGEFPAKLLDNMRWTTCRACGITHARSVCPMCTPGTPETKQLTVVRGKVTARQVFETEGVILKADYQAGQLRWIYHADGQYRREDQSALFAGELDPELRFRISRDATLVAKDGRLITIRPGQENQVETVGHFGHRPMFDANVQRTYWVYGGQLRGSGQLGSEYIGDVLEGQTLFWVGPAFGLGFYRAGQIQVGFTFDAQRRGIKDDLPLTLAGQLIHATAVFSKTHGWLFTSSREGAETINRATVVTADGTVVAMGETAADDGSWLGTIRGHTAIGEALFAATDEGIVRVEPDGGALTITKQFPDTEPFVDSGMSLHATRDGFAAVSRRRIRMLQMS